MAGKKVNPPVTQGDVIVPTGTTVNFAARNEIQLEDGFSVESGAVFSAYIDGSVYSVVSFADDPAPTTQDMALADASSTNARQQTSPLTMQDNTASAELLILYPNPAQTSLTVGLPMTSTAPRQAVIYNSTGSEVLRGNLLDLQTTLDISTLPNGLYYLRTTYQGQNLTSRFSIEH